MSGQSTAWESLRIASEALLESNVELAEAIVTAAELRVLRGSLLEVYDSRGHLYSVPQYCWSTPTNVMSDADYSERASRVIPHVGPAVPMTVRVRLSASRINEEQDIKLTIASSDTTHQIRERLHAELLAGTHDGGAGGSVNRWAAKGLPPEFQTIVFNGAVLRDAQHMQGARLQDDSVLQVFVRPPPGAPSVKPIKAT